MNDVLMKITCGVTYTLLLRGFKSSSPMSCGSNSCHNGCESGTSILLFCLAMMESYSSAYTHAKSVASSMCIYLRFRSMVTGVRCGPYDLQGQWTRARGKGGNGRKKNGTGRLGRINHAVTKASHGAWHHEYSAVFVSGTLNCARTVIVVPSRWGNGRYRKGVKAVCQRKPRAVPECRELRNKRQ